MKKNNLPIIIITLILMIIVGIGLIIKIIPYIINLLK